VSMASPRLQIMEHGHHAHKVKAQFADRYPDVVDGYFVPDDSPGLGVDINEDRVRALADRWMTGSPVVGLTVVPEWGQGEGVEAWLDKVQSRSGVTAIATPPYVKAPSGAPLAGREPPVDAGAGKVRLLDRPLWGKREIFCRTA